nr:hypothetical protein [Tanacetum cinerariifolium]
MAITSTEMKRMENVPYASANSGEAHWTAVKNILKYLRNIKDTFMVVILKQSYELTVIAMLDLKPIEMTRNLKLAMSSF